MDRKNLEIIISECLSAHVRTAGRGSESVMVPAVTSKLTAAGLTACKYRLPGPVAMVRHPDTAEVLPPAHRTIDIAVFEGSSLIALIESEHDVADARDFDRPRGKRGGHSNYAVDSLARRGDGRYFRSYLSLERMAYGAMLASSPDSSPEALTERLMAIQSDKAADHNPSGLPLYLLLECDDPRLLILRPRLLSLDCTTLIAR